MLTNLKEKEASRKMTEKKTNDSDILVSDVHTVLSPSEDSGHYEGTTHDHNNPKVFKTNPDRKVGMLEVPNVNNLIGNLSSYASYLPSSDNESDANETSCLSDDRRSSSSFRLMKKSIKLELDDSVECQWSSQPSEYSSDIFQIKEESIKKEAGSRENEHGSNIDKEVFRELTPSSSNPDLPSSDERGNYYEEDFPEVPDSFRSLMKNIEGFEIASLLNIMLDAVDHLQSSFDLYSPGSGGNQEISLRQSRMVEECSSAVAPASLFGDKKPCSCITHISWAMDGSNHNCHLHVAHQQRQFFESEFSGPFSHLNNSKSIPIQGDGCPAVVVKHVKSKHADILTYMLSAHDGEADLVSWDPSGYRVSAVKDPKDEDDSAQTKAIPVTRCSRLSVTSKPHKSGKKKAELKSSKSAKKVEDKKDTEKKGTARAFKAKTKDKKAKKVEEKKNPKSKDRENIKK